MTIPRPGRTSAIAAAALSAFLIAGCADRGGGSGDAPEGTGGNATPATTVSGDFGDLTGVCKPGTAKGSTAQGVSDKEIQVGVMSDIGFTKNSEFGDAAKVFTSWCNDAGGINGRKLKPVVRDAKMTEVRQRTSEACREDFALVGGGSGLDGMGAKERLGCLLPDFPAQTAQPEAQGSDLQISVQAHAPGYWPYEGFYGWLTKEAYPGSAGAVGIISGDSPVTKVMRDKTAETLRNVGANPSYTELYPGSGVSDWTPYAQSIKDKNVRGLIFLGDYRSLAKLEQALTTMQYKLDWIDANSNAYTPDFQELAGANVLAYQNNVADLGGVAPLETASTNKAVKQVVDLYAKYAPGAKLTFPALKAFSSWLVFAKSATACGDNVTRKCVFEAAQKETNWTGGGLQAPVDLSQHLPVKCYNVEKATPEEWQPADFRPTDGTYRCDAPATKLTGDYGHPVTLADVGKSMADFR